jgi:hypothetical protein
MNWMKQMFRLTNHNRCYRRESNEEVMKISCPEGVIHECEEGLIHDN